MQLGQPLCKRLDANRDDPSKDFFDDGQKTEISISADGDFGEMKKTETSSTKVGELACMRRLVKRVERRIYWLARGNCCLSITIDGSTIDKVQTFDFRGLTRHLYKIRSFEGLVIAFPLRPLLCRSVTLVRFRHLLRYYAILINTLSP